MDALYIKKAFTDYIKAKVPVKFEEQREFLIKHERRHIAERNCLEQHNIASLKMGARYQKKQMDQLILAAAQIFCQCALAAKVKDLMTEAELKRVTQNSEESRMKDAQDMVDQMEKEAMSTAITKPLPGFRDDAKEASGHDGDQPAGDRGHGPTVLPAGGDPGSSGANA